jgi:hypothetical protein
MTQEKLLLRLAEALEGKGYASDRFASCVTIVPSERHVTTSVSLAQSKVASGSR